MDYIQLFFLILFFLVFLVAAIYNIYEFISYYINNDIRGFFNSRRVQIVDGIMVFVLMIIFIINFLLIIIRLKREVDSQDEVILQKDELLNSFQDNSKLLNQLENRNKDSLIVNMNLERENKKLEKENKTIRGLYRDLGQKNEGLIQENEGLIQRNEDLTKRNEDLTKRNEGLTKRNVDLENKKILLTERYEQQGKNLAECNENMKNAVKQITSMGEVAFGDIKSEQTSDSFKEAALQELEISH